MVPALVDQVTIVFVVPLTRAVNCRCFIDATVAVPGESESPVGATAAEAPAPFCKAAPHPVISEVRQIRQNKRKETIKFGIRLPSLRLRSATCTCRTSHILGILGTEMGD